ncbi:MAG: hypothetical protein VX899_24535 [Myxococcota bacterium]|nr:hypothetical protein [Myxococcota bacterium]
MSDTENEKTETSSAESAEAKKEGATSFPSPIPALVKQSDRAARPGFRSPANNKTKAQKKQRKGKKRR